MTFWSQEASVDITDMMTSSIAPKHLLGQDGKNDMQHDFFSHLILLTLASASCDANGIVNSTIVFIR